MLFAYDGSEHAKAAIEQAGEQLRTGRDALVLTVWEPLEAVPFLGGPLPPVPEEVVDGIAQRAGEVERRAPSWPARPGSTPSRWWSVGSRSGTDSRARRREQRRDRGHRLAWAQWDELRDDGQRGDGRGPSHEAPRDDRADGGRLTRATSLMPPRRQGQRMPGKIRVSRIGREVRPALGSRSEYRPALPAEKPRPRPVRRRSRTWVESASHCSRSTFKRGRPDLPELQIAVGLESLAAGQGTSPRCHRNSRRTGRRRAARAWPGGARSPQAPRAWLSPSRSSD